MDVQQRVYADGVIEVGLATVRHGGLGLAMRWVAPGSYRRNDGENITLANVAGGETDWFLLPHTFGCAVGRTLLEQRAAGLPGFDDAGFNALVAWLIAGEELTDAMCY